MRRWFTASDHQVKIVLLARVEISQRASSSWRSTKKPRTRQRSDQGFLQRGHLLRFGRIWIRLFISPGLLGGQSPQRIVVYGHQGRSSAAGL